MHHTLALGRNWLCKTQRLGFCLQGFAGLWDLDDSRSDMHSRHTHSGRLGETGSDLMGTSAHTPTHSFVGHQSCLEQQEGQAMEDGHLGLMQGWELFIFRE